MGSRSVFRPAERLWRWLVCRIGSKQAVAVGAALLAFLLFFSTLQHEVNGSRDPYATDVGEIQNALPRWGIIHFNGYPLYSLLGSAFVTLLRLLGISPATGASLFSALWGAAAVGLLAVLAMALAVPPLAAGAVGLLLALSTAMWIDASLAEVHTMTVALMLAALVAALRFGRYGRRRDLLWLAFLSGQLVAHQPACLLLAPALAILAFCRWPLVRAVLWRSLPVAIGLGLLGPLTYLYLPIRVWQGAEWVFGSPGTWEGFRHLALDSKAYVIILPQTGAAWLERIRSLLSLLNDDLPLPVLALGLLALVGLAYPRRSHDVVQESLSQEPGNEWETLGLSMVWIPNLALSLIIWEDRVSDALLAAKLPIVAMAVLGIGVVARLLVPLLFSPVGQRNLKVRRGLWIGIGTLWLALVAALYAAHRPAVLLITRDPGARQIVATAAQVGPAPDGKPVVMSALWGVDYWALAYAQAYGPEPLHFRLVKHDADLPGVLTRGEHLLVLAHSFYAWSPQQWEQRLGPLYLSMYAPGVIELRVHPLLAETTDLSEAVELSNGIIVRQSRLGWQTTQDLVLIVHWQAAIPIEHDYSIAVHLVSQDPPTGPSDILLQADRNHPVGGWYPTGRWMAGEVVHDIYPLQVPGGTEPKAVRLCMYRMLSNGQFENTEWLSIPVPERPTE